MADEKTFTKEFRESRENKRIGSNFIGILNDIKRRPSDAAKELEISNEEIQNIINGQIRLSSEIISNSEYLFVSVSNPSVWTVTSDNPFHSHHITFHTIPSNPPSAIMLIDVRFNCTLPEPILSYLIPC